MLPQTSPSMTSSGEGINNANTEDLAASSNSIKSEEAENNAEWRAKEGDRSSTPTPDDKSAMKSSMGIPVSSVNTKTGSFLVLNGSSNLRKSSDVGGMSPPQSPVLHSPMLGNSTSVLRRGSVDGGEVRRVSEGDDVRNLSGEIRVRMSMLCPLVYMFLLFLCVV